LCAHANCLPRRRRYKHRSNAANAAEVRTLNERIPAAHGTNQVPANAAAAYYQRGYDFATYGFGVDGISSDSRSAIPQVLGGLGWKVDSFVISPGSDFGTNLDYRSSPSPWTFRFPKSRQYISACVGLRQCRYSRTLTFTDPKPGLLTVGGGVSIRAYSLEVNLSAGTAISIRGTGFQPGTKIKRR